jgi:hypothetical protein
MQAHGYGHPILQVKRAEKLKPLARSVDRWWRCQRHPPLWDMRQVVDDATDSDVVSTMNVNIDNDDGGEGGEGGDGGDDGLRVW